VPGQQQHHLWRESNPPARRFNFCNRRTSLFVRLLRIGKQSRATAGEHDKAQKQVFGLGKSRWRSMPNAPQ